MGLEFKKNITTLEELTNNLICYSEEEKQTIITAYETAAELHKGMYRQSGEEYITHPLNVAYILVQLGCDAPTIIAGLLHDVIEDTKMTKEHIASKFGNTVAFLVDSVTKEEFALFPSKHAQNLANERKLVVGMSTDIRVSYIKLADRLHNMRTLQYMKRAEKRVENAKETLSLYVPLSEKLGIWQIKNELADLSLKYIDQEGYQKAEETRFKVIEDSKAAIEEMIAIISSSLKEKNIPNHIFKRIKSIYGIYEQTIKKNKTTPEIKDLIVLKTIVQEIEHCYQTLGIIHSLYPPVEGTFKDFIFPPKTTGYRALHTSVYGNTNEYGPTAIHILTNNFEEDARRGIISIGTSNSNTLFPILQELPQIQNKSPNNQDFSTSFHQLLTPCIYVHDETGKVYELPVGATSETFIKKLGYSGPFQVYVNEQLTPLTAPLPNKARVRIVNQ